MKNQIQIERKSKAQQEKRQIRERTVWTGALAWPESAYELALAGGRFVTVPLMKSQADRLKGKPFRIREFLKLATTAQLRVLRNTTPLFLTEPLLEAGRPVEITALRGKGPGGRKLIAGNAPKLIEQELQRRRAQCPRPVAEAMRILRSGNESLIRIGLQKIVFQIKAEAGV